MFFPIFQISANCFFLNVGQYCTYWKISDKPRSLSHQKYHKYFIVIIASKPEMKIFFQKDMLS